MLIHVNPNSSDLVVNERYKRNFQSQPTQSAEQRIYASISFAENINSSTLSFDCTTCSDYMICLFDFISPFFLFPNSSLDHNSALYV